MNRFKTFRNHFNRRLHRLQDTADHLESSVREQVATLAGQTRERIMRGRKTGSDWEKKMERSVRAYPLLYAGGLLALLALVTTSLLLGRKR